MVQYRIILDSVLLQQRWMW